MNIEMASLLGSFLLPVLVLIIVNIKKTGNQVEHSSLNQNNSLDSTSNKASDDETNINMLNPSSGAFMIGGIGGIDTFGNSFGSSISGGLNDD